ncbi:helix-turn-helix domain-containing protein [Cellulomonas sp. SG140]|uniref:helix-turn-helix domain-containing protein n=1 Tax=Cellulomonas sp. SG140 TaxID=2976536 RepID=UPI0021E8B66B|nr:helix-turn-helix transcriptional regulator [Cellulomonas sp. SG140]
MATSPIAVMRAMNEIGQSIGTWRRLRELTVAEAADRAGVSVSTLQRLEHGQGGTVENLLRVARALGILDQVIASVDPMSTDVGRLRAGQALPARVRRKEQR